MSVSKTSSWTYTACFIDHPAAQKASQDHPIGMNQGFRQYAWMLLLGPSCPSKVTQRSSYDHLAFDVQPNQHVNFDMADPIACYTERTSFIVRLAG